MTPSYAAGHFDGCLNLEPQSMDDQYVDGFLAGAALADIYR